MTELLGLPYSPWSEKARWALDARRVPYDNVVYAPLIGEPALRWKLGRWSGVVTVPVLTADDGQLFSDSADIARWADERGDGPTLFPLGRGKDIETFIALSDRGMAAGRGLSLRRMLVDDEALSEMVPKPLRKPLGKVGVGIARMGIKRTMRKYDVTVPDAASLERELSDVLDELRAAIARAPGDAAPKTLLGTFTFADIVMAQVLVAVEPPKHGLRLGRGSRRAFSDPSLRERYADLVAWRDALYEKHRPRG